MRKLKRAAIALLLLIVDTGLKRTSYRTIFSILKFLSPSPNPTTQNHARAVAAARTVEAVARHPRIQASCLRRTLVEWWLLRWLGIPSDVRIGINLTTGHAWLEHHGMVINDHAEIAKRFPMIHSSELTLTKDIKIV